MTRLTCFSMFLLGFFGLGMLQSLPADEDSKSATNAKSDSQDVTESASSPEKQKDERKDKSRQTHTVRPRSLKIEASLDGYFVPSKVEEISLWPQSWSEFKIKEIVPHGTHVQKGETLLKFEDDEINKTIADLELDLHLGELRINRSEQEIPRQERSLERKLAEAEETLKRIKEDYQRYRETERELAIGSANMSLKMSKFNLDYYKDELEQLQKMYEADDLTEETEEIVLRRQKFMVEYAEFNYDLSKHRRELMLKVEIPRRDLDIEESLENAEERVDSAQIANQIDSSIARYELEKLRSQRKESLNKHLKLLADRDLMVIKSPMAGVVYYGQATDGKWSKMAEMRQKLIPGKTADKQTVLMTVLETSGLQVLAMLDEKLRIGVETGEIVEVQPAPEGSEPLEAVVASISSTPVADGKFELRIKLSSELPEWLVAGMSCKMKVVVYEKQDALLVPTKAIHQDDVTDKKYVWAVKEDDKVKKTWIETGRSKGENTEIISGLAAGDVVSLEDEKE